MRGVSASISVMSAIAGIISGVLSVVACINLVTQRFPQQTVRYMKSVGSVGENVMELVFGSQHNNSVQHAIVLSNFIVHLIC